jgi:hypothetical protein
MYPLLVLCLGGERKERKKPTDWTTRVGSVVGACGRRIGNANNGIASHGPSVRVSAPASVHDQVCLSAGR